MGTGPPWNAQSKLTVHLSEWISFVAKNCRQIGDSIWILHNVEKPDRTRNLGAREFYAQNFAFNCLPLEGDTAAYMERLKFMTYLTESAPYA